MRNKNTPVRVDVDQRVRLVHHRRRESDAVPERHEGEPLLDLFVFFIELLNLLLQLLVLALLHRPLHASLDGDPAKEVTVRGHVLLLVVVRLSELR